MLKYVVMHVGVVLMKSIYLVAMLCACVTPLTLPSPPSLSLPLLQVDAVEGVLIYRFQAPLHFANVAVFKSRIELASGVQLVKRRPSPRESDGILPSLFRGVSAHALMYIHSCVVCRV